MTSTSPAAGKLGVSFGTVKQRQGGSVSIDLQSDNDTHKGMGDRALQRDKMDLRDGVNDTWGHWITHAGTGSHMGARGGRGAS